MKNILAKVGLVVFAFVLLAVVPFNFNQIFGYSTSAPTCNNEKPSQVVLYEPNHPLLPKATGVGEVRLNWLKAGRANKYTVGFGTSSGNYIYGAANIADTNNYTVSYLNPGTRYYFAVRGVNDCMPGDWSREWSAVVGGRGATTFAYTGSTGSNVVPKVTLKKQGVGSGNVVPTVVNPTVGGQNLPPVVQPTPTPKVGFFQKILNFFMGK